MHLGERMDWNVFFDDLSPEILLRLGLSLLAGFLIGMERESHGRAAGLRTTLLVCLSACVAMIVSDAFYQESFEMKGPSSWHPDPARLAAGILAGMGFLGAGVIVHQRDHVVQGVTTAATLWFAAIIGLALGSGSLGVGLLSTVLALVILALIPRFENRLENDWYSNLRVSFHPTECGVKEAVKVIESLHMKVKGVDWKEDMTTHERTLLFHVKYKKGDRLTLPGKVMDALRALPDVKSVDWHG
jgi:putative Mg2+ transporter-C (MgtC) family protein